MCQRIVIALALACQPQLLIADEPTTGLDVTTQKAVMDLIVELTRERGMSTILITHDLGLAAAYCDKVVVMEKGRVVETAAAAEIFRNPQHPYTRRLMKATPRVGMQLRDLLPDAPPEAMTASRTSVPNLDPGCAPLLLVENLVKEYPRPAAGSLLAKLTGKAEPEKARLPGRRRHRLFGPARRDARPRWRIRLRQVDDLDDGQPTARPDGGPDRLRRAGYRVDPGQAVRVDAAAPAYPDGVPGSDRQPESALHRRARHPRSRSAYGLAQGPRRPARPAARNWPGWSDCRSS
jgi:oligopeptide/dipeptide ABC transporter ATP-binding protein